MRSVKSIVVLCSVLLTWVGCAEEDSSGSERQGAMDAPIAGQGGAEPGAPVPGQTPAATPPPTPVGPPPGETGDGAEPPPAATPPVATPPEDGASAGTGAPGTLTIEFTTISYGGEYAPMNYGAVWIEDSSGTFVKTMRRWAGDIHATDLVSWTAISGGWGFALLGGSNPGDMMDAVSTATLQAHESHTVTWNLKDGTQQIVPDGSYFVVAEMTESRARDLSGPVMKIEFTKGPEAQTVERPADEAFESVVVHYQP